MNLLDMVQFQERLKPVVCPHCGLIKAVGNENSGCNPAAAEANGTRCGRPPGSKNKPKPEKPKWEKPVKDFEGRPALIKGVINGQPVQLVRLPDPNNPGKYRWYLKDEFLRDIHDFFSLNHAKWNIGKNPDKFVKPNTSLRQRRAEIVEKAKKVPVKPGEEQQLGLFPERSANNEITDKLMTAGVLKRKMLGEGNNANGVYRLELEGGMKGVWKPENEEHNELRRRVGSPLYQREALAGDIATIVGIGNMQPAVVRKVEGQVGALINWAPGEPIKWQDKDQMKFEPQKFWNKLENKEDVTMGAAFDFISRNTDRHGGNFLMDGNKLQLIDHGLAFSRKWDNRHNLVFKLVRDNNPTISKPIKDRWKDKWPSIERAMNNREIPPKDIKMVRNRYDFFMAANTWEELDNVYFNTKMFGEV